MKAIKATCKVTGKPFSIPEAEQEHIRIMNRLLPHLKGQVELPVLHPVESMRRVLTFLNFFHLYRTNSALSQKPVITRFHPALGTKVCTNEEFWSEQVENTSAGQFYDFEKSFFEQFLEVYRKSYMIPLIKVNTEGSDFVNGAANVRNCYLCFNIVESEDCLYCLTHHKGNDNVDCVGAAGCQYCYSCLDIENCYECQHSCYCQNSSSLFGCVDCIGCHDCFGCIGLRNVRYHVYNKKLKPEEYKNFISEQDLGSRSYRRKMLEECQSFVSSQDHRVNHLVNNEGSIGNHLKNSKNAYHCYFSLNLEDCGYLAMSSDSNNCWRGIAINAEYSYDGCPAWASKDLYSYCSVGGEANILSFFLQQNCSHCFGSIALKGKSFCILNQQYTKEEYFDLVPRIVSHMKSTGEWGTFFPPFCSPISFQQSAAGVFMEPVSDEDKRRRKYKDVDLPEQDPPKSFLKASEIYDHIDEIDPADFTNKCVKCTQSGQFFNYQKQELTFYKKHNIPLPIIHWKTRLENLYSKRERLQDDLDE